MAVSSAAAFSRDAVLGAELFDESGQAIRGNLAPRPQAEELQQSGAVHGQTGRLHGQFVVEEGVALGGPSRERRQNGCTQNQENTGTHMRFSAARSRGGSLVFGSGRPGSRQRRETRHG